MSVRDWINLGIVTLIAVVLGATFPEIRGALLALWTLIVAAYLFVLLGGKIARLVFKSRFDQVLSPRAVAASRPDDLQRCEHSFGWKSYSQRDFDHEIRPQLAAIIVHKSKNRTVDGELMNVTYARYEGVAEGRPIRTTDILKIVARIERL